TTTPAWTTTTSSSVLYQSQLTGCVENREIQFGEIGMIDKVGVRRGDHQLALALTSARQQHIAMPAIQFGENIIEQQRRPDAKPRTDELDLGKLHGDDCEPLLAARAKALDWASALTNLQIVTVRPDCGHSTSDILRDTTPVR